MTEERQGSCEWVETIRGMPGSEFEPRRHHKLCILRNGTSAIAHSLRWARAGALLQVTQSGGLFFAFWRKHKNALPPPLRYRCAAKKPPLCKGRWPSAARTEGLLPACAHGNNPPVMASPCQPPLHKGAPWCAEVLQSCRSFFGSLQGLPASREALQFLIRFSAGSCRRPGRPPAR